jgi:hypothetical protein
MARPQVADGDDLQIWRVAANILNKQSRNILKKQSRTAERGWSSSLGVGRGANNPPTIKPFVTYHDQEPRTRTDSLAKRPMHQKWIRDMAPGILGASIG